MQRSKTNEALYEQAMALPPLASERIAQDFEVGQQLLLLSGVQLINAKVHLARPYSSSVTLGPARTITPRELEGRLALLEEREQELAKEDWEPGIMPDKELLRRRILLHPEFQQITYNTSPGCVHLKTAEDPLGFITDMDHNYIIPLDAWGYIKQDKAYREAWLVNGSEESVSKRDTLLQAIHGRIDEEDTAVGLSEDGEFGPRKALPHHDAPAPLPFGLLIGAYDAATQDLVAVVEDCGLAGG